MLLAIRNSTLSYVTICNNNLCFCHLVDNNDTKQIDYHTLYSASQSTNNKNELYFFSNTVEYSVYVVTMCGGLYSHYGVTFVTLHDNLVPNKEDDIIRQKRE